MVCGFGATVNRPYTIVCFCLASSYSGRVPISGRKSPAQQAPEKLPTHITYLVDLYIKTKGAIGKGQDSGHPGFQDPW